MTQIHDVAVIGGGLAGKAAMHVALRRGLEVLHVAPATGPDRRTSALMMPTVEHLLRLGLVEDPETLGVPLEEIRIIDATNRLLRAPEALFAAREIGLSAFGWNFANTALAAAFDAARLDGAGLVTVEAALETAERSANGWTLRLSDGTTRDARLLVGADGKGSKVRDVAGIAANRHDFTQAALVCDVSAARGLNGCSVEFHYPDGPFTLVPAGGDRANLVWIDRRERLDAARATDPQTLAQELAARAQNLFGAITPLGPAVVFPLSTLSARMAGRDGAVLVGESAHAFPPIGAQGLNLGLRDVADLDAVLGAADIRSPDWAERAAADYARRRQGDLVRTGRVVDALFRSLLSDLLPAQALRAGGLWALKSLPVLRRAAFAIGMGRR